MLDAEDMCVESTVGFTNLVTPDDRQIVVEEGLKEDLGSEMVDYDDCCRKGLVGCIEEAEPENPKSGSYDPESMTCELTGYMTPKSYKTPLNHEYIDPSSDGSTPLTFEEANGPMTTWIVE